MTYELDNLVIQEIYRYREGHCRWPTHVSIPWHLKDEVRPYWIIPEPSELSLSWTQDAGDLSPCMMTNTVQIERHIDREGHYQRIQAITRIPPMEFIPVV